MNSQPSRSRTTRTGPIPSLAPLWTAVGVLILTSCGDTSERPAAPEAEGAASVAVTASLPAGNQTEIEEVFGRVDRIRVRLERSDDGEVVLDREIAFDPGGDGNEISVRHTLSAARVDFLLEVEARRGPDPLFRGDATITLRAGRTTAVELALEPVPSGVTILTEGPVAFRAVGETRQAEAEASFATGDPIPGLEPDWSSLDQSVTEVTPDGLLTAAGPGETSVVASAGPVADSLLVQVPDVAGVEVSPAEARAFEGDTVDFDATARDAEGSVIEGARFLWSSTNTTVATVDDIGRAVAHGDGTTLIVAAAGQSADTAELAVDPAVASVEVSPQSETVFERDTTDFDATAVDSEGAIIPGVDFTWSSSNTTVAMVNDTGRVVTSETGSALIIAAAGGVADTADLTVTTLQIGAVPGGGGIQLVIGRPALQPPGLRAPMPPRPRRPPAR